MKPNIILIHADQFRGDCLSLLGHPDLSTPNLDHLARSGAYFSNAYTPAPICSPARRSLMTGHCPATDGALDNTAVRIPIPEDTLPNLLRKAGYQTAEIGRNMHQAPGHARYGFEIRESSPFQSHDSHVHWTIRQTSHTGEFDNWPHLLNHGMPLCGYGARPWPYDESFHETTWSTNKAIEFMDRSDKEVPFFASIGYVAPHPPLVPPQCYYDRYIHRKLSPPAVGEWVDDWIQKPENLRGLGNGGFWIPHDTNVLHESMAGYYGMINHLDDMLFNLLQRISYIKDRPTYILFCSDHGEMLGDHLMFRKSRPYEGSIKVPFMLSGPDIPSDLTVDAPVCLQDILPTLCEIAGVEVPGHVEGKSVLSLLKGNTHTWRPYIHSEMPENIQCTHLQGWHSLTDGKTKYIWHSSTGHEQLFDLENDPKECRDLSAKEGHTSLLEIWREHLTSHLAERPEGFVKNNRLIAGQAHRSTMPHAVSV